MISLDHFGHDVQHLPISSEPSEISLLLIFQSELIDFVFSVTKKYYEHNP